MVSVPLIENETELTKIVCIRSACSTRNLGSSDVNRISSGYRLPLAMIGLLSSSTSSAALMVEKVKEVVGHHALRSSDGD